jgi:membrane protease YdiL (CAAX protease family)
MISIAPMLSKVKAFLLPDNLKPLQLNDFTLRFASFATIALSLLLLFAVNPSWWFSWRFEDTTLYVRTATVETALKESEHARFGPDADCACNVFSNTRRDYLYLGCACAIQILCAACFPVRILRQELMPAHRLRTFGIIAISLALAVGGARLIEKLGGYEGDPTAEWARRAPGWYLILNVSAIAILGPLIEELTFRFGLFRGFRQSCSFYASALLSSIAFGILHMGYPDPTKILLCVLMGFVLAWSYEFSGSFLAPLGIHLCNNFVNALLRGY